MKKSTARLISWLICFVLVFTAAPIYSYGIEEVKELNVEFRVPEDAYAQTAATSPDSIQIEIREIQEDEDGGDKTRRRTDITPYGTSYSVNGLAAGSYELQARLTYHDREDFTRWGNFFFNILEDGNFIDASSEETLHLKEILLNESEITLKGRVFDQNGDIKSNAQIAYYVSSNRTRYQYSNSEGDYQYTLNSVDKALEGEHVFRGVPMSGGEGASKAVVVNISDGNVVSVNGEAWDGSSGINFQYETTLTGTYQLNDGSPVTAGEVWVSEEYTENGNKLNRRIYRTSLASDGTFALGGFSPLTTYYINGNSVDPDSLGSQVIVFTTDSLGNPEIDDVTLVDKRSLIKLRAFAEGNDVTGDSDIIVERLTSPEENMNYSCFYKKGYLRFTSDDGEFLLYAYPMYQSSLAYGPSVPLRLLIENGVVKSINGETVEGSEIPVVDLELQKPQITVRTKTESVGEWLNTYFFAWLDNPDNSNKILYGSSSGYLYITNLVIGDSYTLKVRAPFTDTLHLNSDTILLSVNEDGTYNVNGVNAGEETLVITLPLPYLKGKITLAEPDSGELPNSNNVYPYLYRGNEGEYLRVNSYGEILFPELEEGVYTLDIFSWIEGYGDASGIQFEVRTVNGEKGFYPLNSNEKYTSLDGSNPYIITLTKGNSEPENPDPGTNPDTGSNPDSGTNGNPSSESGTPKPELTQDSDGRKVVSLKPTKTSENKDGSVRTVLTDDKVRSALAVASGSGTQERSSLNVTVESNKGGGSELVLPLASLKAVYDAGTIDYFNIKSEAGAIALSAATVLTIIEQAAQNGYSGDVTFAVKPVQLQDASNIVLTEQDDIELRPAYSFEITVGGNRINDFSAGGLTLTVPYIAGADEKWESVLINFIDDNGGKVPVPSSVYNPETNQITFRANQLSVYAVGYKEASFKDLPASHWGASSINYLAARDVLVGNQGLVQPDMSITRAQFVKLLAVLEGVGNQPVSSTGFKDVADGAWYAPYIAWAAESGIVSGYDDGTFGPDDFITREQMCVILKRYADKFGILLNFTRSSLEFADKGNVNSIEAANAIDALYRAGVVEGNNNAFYPDDYATRAAAARVITLLLNQE